MSEQEAEAPKKKARKKASTQESPHDVMLTDPETVQKEKFAGTTSDAASRAEGTTYDDVDPDPDNNPDKQSDAEDYGFPPGGDVDRATVDPGSGDGESWTPITIEDWVILDGSHEAVPDKLDGRRAAVLQVDPPYDLVPPEEMDDVRLTVRTRDDVNATLVVPFDAVKEVQRRGVSPQRL